MAGIMAETEYDLFLSFARDADEAYVVREIAPRLQGELHRDSLKKINIWLNRSDAPATDAWDRVIAGESGASAFLLAFITPAWFEDPLCRLEAQLFQSIERQIGRRDLILPVWFQTTPDLENPRISVHPTLAADLASRWLLRVDEMSFNVRGDGSWLSVKRLAGQLQGHFGSHDQSRVRRGSTESPEADDVAEQELEGPQLLAPSPPPGDFHEIGTDEGADEIREWFFYNYEDPAQHTPYESREGGYQYIWGGPYDARDIIENAFDGLARPSQIERAVNEIEADGFEWAPNDRRVLPPDDELGPGISRGDSDGLSAVEAHRNMLQRIEELEAKLTDLGQGPAGMGHNQPPEPIPDELPVTRAEFDQLSQDVAHLKSLPAQPDRAQLTEVKAIQDRTESLGRRIAGWILKKADRFVDATVIVAGTKAGSEILGIAPALLEVGQTIWTWLTTLGWPL